MEAHVLNAKKRIFAAGGCSYFSVSEVRIRSGDDVATARGEVKPRQ
jgi:hypothetical protein